MPLRGGFTSIQPALVRTYPALPVTARGWLFKENFSRKTLLPTNWPTLYLTGGTGTESIVMVTSRRLRVASGSTTGNDASVLASEAGFNRVKPSLTQFHDWTQIKMKIDFVLSASAADIEGFVGLLNSANVQTAIPTTTRHLGLYWDTSAQANFRISSANGSTQVDTDSTVALDQVAHRLEIDWTNIDVAQIRFYETVSAATPTTTVDVTALGDEFMAMALHFFVETEANAAKNVEIAAWSAEFL